MNVLYHIFYHYSAHLLEEVVPNVNGLANVGISVLALRAHRAVGLIQPARITVYNTMDLDNAISGEEKKKVLLNTFIGICPEKIKDLRKSTLEECHTYSSIFTCQGIGNNIKQWVYNFNTERN